MTDTHAFDVPTPDTHVTRLGLTAPSHALARGSVYLCGPIAGLSLGQASGWRGWATQHLNKNGWHVLNPLSNKQGLPITQPLDDYYDIAGWRSSELYQRDVYHVRQASVVLANLADAERVSIGSVCEITLAAELRKLVVLVLPDDDKLHRHPFVVNAASIVFSTLDDALYYIVNRL